MVERILSESGSRIFEKERILDPKFNDNPLSFSQVLAIITVLDGA